MELYNLKHPSQKVSFSEAVQLGLGKDRGLFFPAEVPQVDDIDALLAKPFVERSQEIIHLWLQGEIEREVSDALVAKAFNFELPLAKVDGKRWCLELFHGPTLAFKDFGARFMAQCVNHLAGDAPLTILTATSGDTGAAVADAFYGLDKVRVVVLYPKGKISVLQEKMFSTLGGNIHTVAVTSDFDACQDLVKQAFEDADVRNGLRLNSANSINISRLLAQVCYYFEAVAQFRQANPGKAPVISVPSGNFGNLTAGLLAKAMGLPVARFVAATNSNDTVPRYLAEGQWQVNPTQATMSNAMDVSDPSNWPRVETLCKQQGWGDEVLSGVALSEAETSAALAQLYKAGYQSEPHGAIAAQALSRALGEGEKGLFLGTAHPAKFKDVVDRELELDLPLPEALADVAGKPVLSVTLLPEFTVLKEYLFARLA
ncbi:threonine synthase [Shewanella corallii]|uniref:Threonine synthase n=1 Tax=Shewanella corallii TaxID=560080 RepID=A0ABT0N4I8_9GAMM|nr:threonine synthase [Shewanella corallii]MCL2913376.1 threonine synthase [Shewanella corallii]